jgi:nucleotide-binding universal stress UspA family protein
MARSDADTLYVAAAPYDDVDAAVADYEAVKALYREVRSSHDFDAAVIRKTTDGKVTIVKKHEQPTRHEAAAAVHVVAVEGHPARVLMRKAEGARLLVLGSRSRSRNQLEGVVLGSVALHAVMHAPCPVLVVHPPRTGRSPAPQQAAAAPAAG